MSNALVLRPEGSVAKLWIYGGFWALRVGLVLVLWAVARGYLGVRRS